MLGKAFEFETNSTQNDFLDVFILGEIGVVPFVAFRYWNVVHPFDLVLTKGTKRRLEAYQDQIQYAFVGASVSRTRPRSRYETAWKQACPMSTGVQRRQHLAWPGKSSARVQGGEVGFGMVP